MQEGTKITRLVLAAALCLLPTLMHAETNFAVFPKWQHALEGLEYCRPDCFDFEFKSNPDTRELVGQVNRYVNNVYEYEEEMTDYWKTPQEFVHDGGGDCEDFAIMKYMLLLNLGFADEDMDVVVGHVKGEAHAVLTLRLGRKLLVLDNQTNKLLDKNYFKQMKVAFRINRNGWERG